MSKKLTERCSLKKSISLSTCKLLTCILENTLKGLEEEISEISSHENVEKIKSQVQGLSSISGEFSSGKMWQVKKALFPQINDKPMAKKDKSGNIITSKDALKSLYINTYHDRLNEKDIAEDLKDLKTYKEILCNKRIELVKLNKSEEVTIEKLEKVLNGLKKNK